MYVCYDLTCIGEVVYVLPKEGSSPTSVLGRLAQVSVCGSWLLPSVGIYWMPAGACGEVQSPTGKPWQVSLLRHRELHWSAANLVKKHNKLYVGYSFFLNLKFAFYTEVLWAMDPTGLTLKHKINIQMWAMLSFTISRTFS